MFGSLSEEAPAEKEIGPQRQKVHLTIRITVKQASSEHHSTDEMPSILDKKNQEHWVRASSSTCRKRIHRWN